MIALEVMNREGLAPAVEQLRLAGRPPGNLGVDDFVALQSSRLAVFQALLEGRAGREDEARKSWQAAAGANDDDIEGEGLFRAIGMIHTGRRTAAEQWFSEFERVNRQRKNDNSTEVRVQARYLAGIYETFRGREEMARQEFEQALAIDQSYLFARQALEWLKAGLLGKLAESAKVEGQ
jgi:tetratricopeptide (TPR) repeat protein